MRMAGGTQDVLDEGSEECSDGWNKKWSKPGAPSPFCHTGAQVLSDRRLDLLVSTEPSFELEDGNHIVLLPKMPES